MKYILTALLITLLACSSKDSVPATVIPGPTPVPSPAIPVTSLTTNLKPLTSLGENQMGRFSNDGSKIIFLSRMRPGQKNSQVYILNLLNLRERRITYNDGDDFSPSFDPTGNFIYYSSTTDEIKEHPEDPAPDASLFHPQEIIDSKANFEEIYQSEVDGSHIKRLTQTVGFDGSPNPAPDGRHTVFVSQRAGNFELYLMDSRGKMQNRILKSTDFIARPSFSPNGKLIAFESRAQGQNSVHIKTMPMWGKVVTLVTTREVINRDPSWSPDSKRLIFSSNRENENAFLLYSMNVDGSCLKKITSAPKSKPEIIADLYPVLSPDGKKLLFTSNRSGTYQLYLIDFDESTDCPGDKG